MIILCLIGFHLNGISQGKRQAYEEIVSKNKGDSLQVNALNQLYKLDRRNDPEKAKKYLDDAYNLARKIGYMQGEAYSLISYGDYYRDRGDYEQAGIAFSKSKNLYTILDDPGGVANSLNGLGIVANGQGNYSLALDYFLTYAELIQLIKILEIYTGS